MASTWTRLAFAYGLLVSAVISHFLLTLPIQVYDGLPNVLRLEGSLFDLLAREFSAESYLRPLLWAQFKIVYDVAGGEYFWWYRGLHAVQATLLILLFVGLLRPRTGLDMAAVPLALAVLIGNHTFPGTVREAFPINTFMVILLCCAATAHLVLAQRSAATDAALAALFGFAALTVELGLVVWVLVACAWLSGAPGATRRTVGVLTVCLIAYFVLRFQILQIGSPGLIERASGYGFGVYDPEDLEQMFGANPWPFYAYNVATSAVSALFAEPRSGVWLLTRSVVEGEWRASLVVNVIASTCATGAIVWYLWRRRGAWLARELDRNDQLVAMFLGALAASAAISYPYTKDTVLSPAGFFFAAATYVAVRELAARPARSRFGAAMVLAVCAVLAATWTIRFGGTLYAIRHQASNVRGDWAYLAQEAEENMRPRTPTGVAVRDRLRNDAIMRYPRSLPYGGWTAVFDLETK